MSSRSTTALILGLVFSSMYTSTRFSSWSIHSSACDNHQGVKMSDEADTQVHNDGTPYQTHGKD